MKPWKYSKVHDYLADAFRARDHKAFLQILTEQVEQTSGAEKAYWLRYRAQARQIFGSSEHMGLIEADLARARELDPFDVESTVDSIMIRAAELQQPELLKGIPAEVRRQIPKEMFGNWRYWSGAGYIHRLRRRWYQSYRAYTRALRLFRALTPEQRRNVDGWIIQLCAWRARAAVRCGRLQEAAADVALASEQAVRKDRAHVHPLALALARAELAFSLGEYQSAKSALQRGLAVISEGKFKATPFGLIECDLLAARIARAEGNQAGFENFCRRALELCVKNQLRLAEAEVRAVSGGALW